METKKCKSCLAVKSVSDFYAQPNADGLAATCKPCYCARVRANRARRVDEYRTYDRERNMRPDRVAARTAYKGTDAGKEMRRREQARERSIRRDAYLARTALNNAVRDGKIKRQPCSVCGERHAHGHHADYSKPLDVVWLCSRHHTDIHQNSKEA